MIIAAFDVHYMRHSCVAAAVVFSNYRDAEPLLEYTQFMPVAAEYIPGMLYKRELPCILSLLRQFDREPDEVIVDAHVMLGNKPGLGQHLFNHFAGRIPVIGVAKSKLAGVMAAEVFRGGSKKPLQVTSAGMDLLDACERIQSMYGAYRIPTLLKRADTLARDKAKELNAT